MRFALALTLVFLSVSHGSGGEPISICTFQCDATPPLGAPLCDAAVPPAKEIVDPLSMRGLVILGSGQPIVLVAVDWVGIGNGGYDTFRDALAKAAHTSADRVALHALHQHDAPGCDFEAEQLLAANSLSGAMFHVEFARAVMARAAKTLEESLHSPQRVTHVGVGVGRVDRVASNRRVLGPDGKVRYVRYSASTIPEAVAAPEGVIDPQVRVLSLWNGDRPLAVLSYYATHPQSHYGEGGVSYDFVGMARQLREQALPGVPHIHFNGASGNVAAGKYNDGAPENRPALAGRLADGMKAAWESTARTPLDAAHVEWRTKGVQLPLRDALENEAPLVGLLENTSAKVSDRVRAARDLVWARRTKAGHAIELSCLKLGSTYVVHMPGELFVEYQLTAAKLRPNNTVCMAAYGDYGAGYIGTEIAYSQGGYETSYVSRVAPTVEHVLMEGLQTLLK
ncbi:MAG TPA: hypothetical protein VL175_11325 [Pirellulales bacterium]|jgi:hypothetical protein|nr:hypothetical protein [Pirellulales bacterium]